MHRAQKAKITDLNQHLICQLCKGYFIDATTIIECLHSFCRSCIVKYLQSNKYCPICDVQVHKSKPFLNIRPDKTLQDVVYKLVPRLLQNELQRRQEFSIVHPETKSSLDQMYENHQHLVPSDESISVILSYHGCKKSARYLQCPSAVSVGHLQKLIRAKYDLSDSHHVDILHNQDCLNSSLTLTDIAYIYSWIRKAPMELTYRIYQQAQVKKLKLSCDENAKQEVSTVVSSTNNNNNWKEVQLRISENGEMSITGIQDDEIVNNNNYKSDLVTVVENAAVQKELPDVQLVGNIDTNSVGPVTSATVECVSATVTTTTNNTCETKTVYSTINSSKCSVGSENKNSEPISCKEKPVKDTEISEKSKVSDVPKKTKPPQSPAVTTSNDKGTKRKLESAQNLEQQQPPKKEKQTILNHAIGVQNLSNNHPLKKHAQINKTTTVDTPVKDTVTTTASTTTTTTITATVTTTTNTVTTNSSDTFPKPNFVNRSYNVNSSRPGTPKPPSKPCYMPKPVINIPKPNTSITKPEKLPQPVSKHDSKQPHTVTTPTSHSQSVNKLGGKIKTSTPIGYKTLRDPPKSWNSQIAKANINKPVPDPKYSDAKNVRPAKFFKMRNNIPRYLGNPASGVKPMYQVHVSPEKDKEKQEQVPTSSSSTSTSSSTSSTKSEIRKHSIVKIDPKTLKPISEKAPETTSLSNTTDLKINASSVSIFNPLKLQNSPKGERKSPKSPKSSSPTTKRDKLNIKFTPPNPFVPNLTSPTVSPNQFLYPTGPPGFPSYDPRVMAVYHNLFYGQRMAFPPGLSLDLNQRKGFDLSGPPSPKLGLHQPHSPQISHKLPTTEQLALQSSSRNSNSLGFKPPNSQLKKNSKESTGKNEKSLQNAVEKLTQNRVKEIKNELVVASNTRHSPPKQSDRRSPMSVPTKEKDKNTPQTSVSENAVASKAPETNNAAKQEVGVAEKEQTLPKNGETNVKLKDTDKKVSEEGSKNKVDISDNEKTNNK